MPQKSPAAGIQVFDHRTGLSIGRLRGMNRATDPASIPPTQHHLLVNARITPNGIRERPGLTTNYDTGSAECIVALIEIEDSLSRGAFMELPIDYRIAPWDDTNRIGILNEYAEDVYARVYDPDAYSDDDAPAPGHITIYPTEVIERPTRVQWETAFTFRNKQLIFGRWTNDDGDGEEALLEIHPPKESTDAAYLSVYLKLGESPPGGDSNLMSVAVRRERSALSGELEDVLYIGTADGRVLRWDETTLSTELEPSGADDCVVRMCLVAGHGLLVLMTPSQTNGGTEAYGRYQAAAGEAWQSVTVPATLDTTGIIAFASGAYVWSDDKLYVFDPSTLGFTDTYTYVPTSGTWQGGVFPFILDGRLYIVGHVQDGSLKTFDLWKRNADDDWEMVFPLNAGSDYYCALNWVYPVSPGKLLVGGWFWEATPDPAYAGHVIVEYDIVAVTGRLVYGLPIDDVDSNGPLPAPGAQLIPVMAVE